MFKVELEATAVKKRDGTNRKDVWRILANGQGIGYVSKAMIDERGRALYQGSTTTAALYPSVMSAAKALAKEELAAAYIQINGNPEPEKEERRIIGWP